MRRARTLIAFIAGLAAIGCETRYPALRASKVVSTIDVSRFDSVLVAGFATTSDDPIDTNDEMSGLLRSQLRATSQLRVLDAGAGIVPADGLSDAAYWKKVGAEYGGPLIVTGTVRFRQVIEPAPVWTGPSGAIAPLKDRARFTLEPAFVFIDGGSGEALHFEALREEIVYGFGQNVPALAAFFDLMNRMLPGVLRIVGQQAFCGKRMLLR